MLLTRQMIPPITAHTAAGRTIRAWDFKQKKNLIIAFLDAGCPATEIFLRHLAGQAARLTELEAQALVIFPELPRSALAEISPQEIILAADMSGRATRAYLGKDALSHGGPATWGIFVTDRYGELFAQWSGGGNASLPAVGEILSWLLRIEMEC
jgi:hypothetical protein